MGTVFLSVRGNTEGKTGAALLENIPPNWQLQKVVVGQNWIFSLLINRLGNFGLV
jgi:hypothetical protein